MQDRPDARELLEAVRAFLHEQVVPALEGTRQFHARVAANVLAIVGRELAGGDRALREEWRSLSVLLDRPATAPPVGGAELADAVRALNEALATRIRDGEADAGSFRDAVVHHLRETANARLAIANPKYALIDRSES
jgi:hypothetical protein